MTKSVSQLGPEVPDQGMGRTTLLPEGSSCLFRPLAGAHGPWSPSAGRHVPATSASLVTGHSCPCASPQKGVQHGGSRACRRSHLNLIISARNLSPNKVPSTCASEGHSATQDRRRFAGGHTPRPRSGRAHCGTVACRGHHRSPPWTVTAALGVDFT